MSSLALVVLFAALVRSIRDEAVSSLVEAMISALRVERGGVFAQVSSGSAQHVLEIAERRGQIGPSGTCGAAFIRGTLRAVI